MKIFPLSPSHSKALENWNHVHFMEIPYKVQDETVLFVQRFSQELQIRAE